MRQILIVLAVALLASVTLLASDDAPDSAEQATAPSYGSLAEAKAAAAEKNMPMILDFYTDW